MKILCANVGSTSFKYEILDLDDSLSIVKWLRRLMAVALLLGSFRAQVEHALSRAPHTR